MNTTGQNGETAGYKVILLLVVGLTAFSSAIKELNQLRQFALDASHLVAQWSDKFAPAQLPPAPPATEAPRTIEIEHTAMIADTCDIKQSLPAVELPWLSNVGARATRPKVRAVVPRPSQVIDFKSDFPRPDEIQIAKLKKFAPINIDPVQLEYRFTTGADADTFVFSERPVSHGKTRSRKQRDIKINPRDREIFLKSLNRSISLRFAS